MSNEIKIYIYKDSGIKLPNKLIGKRISRYNEAIRERTKRKILVSSYFIYKVLRINQVPKDRAIQAFSKSAHEIKGLPFSVSFSNAEPYYALAISEKNVGIDIENYKERSKELYEKYVDESIVLSLEELKESFYRNWIEKEAKYKSVNDSIPKHMGYFKVSDLMIGIYHEKPHNILSYEVDIQSENGILKCKLTSL
ncbi:hypothetical protein [Lactococcus allomyrinae]|uniref:4'-phosphopantetheinyl transferase superfamily protein n=1 Tax=Lactococcus allomyrinae TaxID=2419773 RepID=A0A387BM10_9LACT|nr:hypothetical protein [Lactococcus allomyrinae]AYG02066.1 hypothetical protein D7I46_13095 [Lactococcus allomyrinae]